MAYSVDRSLRAARALESDGNFAAAEQIYSEILSRFPGNAKARAGLRNIQAETAKELAPSDFQPLLDLHRQGRLEELLHRAADLLKDYPTSPALFNIVGVASNALGRSPEALDAFDRAVALKPDYAEAYNNRGNLLRKLGRASDAVASYDRAIELEPRYVVAYYNRGIALETLGRLEEALSNYDKALGLGPDHFGAMHNRANLLLKLGKLEQALAGFEAAIGLRPNVAGLHSNYGNALHHLGRLDEAMAAFEAALAIQPDNVDALVNMGLTLRAMVRIEDALAAYDRAIALAPDLAVAHCNRGNVLFGIGSLEAALASYDEAIRLGLDEAPLHTNRGIVLLELRRPDEALGSFEKAMAIEPNDAETLSSMGNAYRALTRPEEALSCYERALQIRPDFEYPLAQKLSLSTYLCDWTALSTVDFSKIGLSQSPVVPFTLLLVDDDPGRNLTRARKWAAAKFVVTGSPEFSRPAFPGKIKVGYFSADFYAHATMVLMASLFELHDSDRFEIQAFSYGPDIRDEMVARLEAAVARVHDVRTMSDADVAALSRSEGIDIAVDLKGYTQWGRPGIFAHRAAPVQINYLGYPGTMGSDFIDYMIADPVLIPDEQREFYSEKIIRLPDSYQVNDRQRRIAERHFSRAELGLPEDGFVFCCFNNNYKITPEEFDVWARLLHRVERSVLWLIRDNEFSEANLRKEAVARGIAPDRLIFAERMLLAEHLARHRCADLFLDTFACNAHTTASDALWTGLPVVTKQGKGFTARVASSLLHACGLPELVTTTTRGYEELALTLATDPARLAAIKAKLVANRDVAPLFDADRFRRHLEQSYDSVLARHRSGLPPDHLDIPPIS